jgi:hypothetical protein
MAWLWLSRDHLCFVQHQANIRAVKKAVVGLLEPRGMDAGEPTEARSGTAAPWTRYRPAGGVNRRTRRGKRWDAIRAGYVERMTRTPTPDDEDLLDSLADLRLDQERLRHRLTSGLSIGRRTMVELVTEIRRLRLALGLGTEAELTLGQLLGVD